MTTREHTTGWVIASMALLACVLGGCKGMDAGALTGAIVTGIRASSLDERDEKELGRTVALQLTTTYKLSSDEALNDYVALVGATISGATPRPDLEYNFGVLETKEVGAWAGPSGYILVTTGAIALMQDEAELAGVLAHEMAHAVKQHGLAAVKNAGMMQALVQAAGSHKDARQFVGLMSNAADVIVSKPYGRDQEREADTQAVKYLIDTGYNPAGLQKFLSRLQRIQGSAAGTGQMLSTHPGMDERISTVARLIAKAGSPGGATMRERFLAQTASVPKRKV